MAACLEIGVPEAETPAPAKEAAERLYTIPAGQHHAAEQYKAFDGTLPISL